MFEEKTVFRNALMKLTVQKPEKESLTMPAVMTPTAAAVRSWHLSMNRPAEFAVGGFLWQKAMVFGFPLIITVKFPNRCK